VSPLLVVEPGLENKSLTGSGIVVEDFERVLYSLLFWVISARGAVPLAAIHHRCTIGLASLRAGRWDGVGFILPPLASSTSIRSRENPWGENGVPPGERLQTGKMGARRVVSIRGLFLQKQLANGPVKIQL